MERGMRRNAHVPCGAGEKLENLKLKFKYQRFTYRYTVDLAVNEAGFPKDTEPVSPTAEYSS